MCHTLRWSVKRSFSICRKFLLVSRAFEESLKDDLAGADCDIDGKDGDIRQPGLLKRLVEDRSNRSDLQTISEHQAIVIAASIFFQLNYPKRSLLNISLSAAPVLGTVSIDSEPCCCSFLYSTRTWTQLSGLYLAYSLVARNAIRLYNVRALQQECNTLWNHQRTFC